MSEEKKKQLSKPDKEAERPIQETAHVQSLRAPDKDSERIFQASKKKEKKDE